MVVPMAYVIRVVSKKAEKILENLLFGVRVIGLKCVCLSSYIWPPATTQT